MDFGTFLKSASKKEAHVKSAQPGGWQLSGSRNAFQGTLADFRGPTAHSGAYRLSTRQLA